ncbi:LysR family transcriptional regulator [Georgenia subflava]|uniref:LysR family transcriptional regulator n=1 Tax=Georgenia subflava TaxID=1622177 RepID=A0A6N7EE50_9MICO|nr:LysR family transcriptional regulator [Georgenia subflava]MPV35483.1 LysR family transcriptional regulator [Georgenia subflava]
MELRQLSYFVCLYREGTVTRAAQRLNIVQPALSAQIAKLESELGHELFERTARGMVPTRAGERAYAAFAPLLEQFLRARSAVRENVEENVDLRVGVIASATDSALIDTVTRMVDTHPGMRLKIIPGFSADLVARLRAGEFDTVVINQTFRHDGLVARDLVDEELVLAASPVAPAPEVVPVPLHRLATTDLVVPSQAHGLRRVVDHVLQAHGLAVRPLIEIDDASIIVDLLRRRPWFSVLPVSQVSREVGGGDLVAYPLAAPGISRRIVSVRDPSRPPTRTETAFVDMLETRLKTLGTVGAGSAQTDPGREHETA